MTYSDTNWARYVVCREFMYVYCVFVGRNLFLWKIKKQHIVACSCVEASYKATIVGACELLYIKQDLQELRI